MVGDQSAVGCVGVLTVDTRGDAGPGEVLVPIRGGTETYLAWSDEPLRRGAPVLVVQARAAREVVVVPWTQAPDQVATQLDQLDP